MTFEQLLILAILFITVALFLWGRFRHDVVALMALLACVVVGLVNPENAFSGFGHPAVITVACVLILSRGLQNAGAVDALTRIALPSNAGRMLSMLALMGLGALLSGFMNNVGAMALLMPVAIHVAKRLELTAGQILMPLAFGTILGGMTTLVGTPPNIIVSGFRAEAGLGSFSMFDFTPIGLAVAVIGILFIALIGWRLVPARKQSGLEGFESGAYITEVRVEKGSKADGMRLSEIEKELIEVDAQIIGIVQKEVKIIAAHSSRRIYENDILMLEAEAESLTDALSILGLKLEESIEQAASEQAQETHTSSNTIPESEQSAEQQAEQDKPNRTGEVSLIELAVLPSSMLAGRSASDISLRTRYGINLLALSREGARSMKRLRSIGIQSGDLLLMQGDPESIAEFAADNGCVPLAERELRIPDKVKIWQASLIMLFAIAGAAFGILPAAVSFAIGVLASMVVKTVPLRQVYEAIDWPVIVLLAALIPVAGAMEATGTADLIACFLLESVAQGNAVIGLALILIVTMFLSDLMNNAATAAVMCPIAIGVATTLGVSPDSFLMAVAIGASCAFLTPIGHQNNTLILGPGGFRFGDYWQLGIALEIIVVAISLPMLLIFWPL
ncbi:MAG TPA: SLC13 family permease [Pseudoalteromonas prydzensis]|uniref:SLC13 family permease n=3 Tax=root TaxID=1 RepID=A0A7V1CZA3_9GAMM|nr:SLC13 family permease [Pseudoalteromonas prydzensis]HEA17043.1 SLC13 family permease [Pseudoalteromonas prydzensis]